jgi:dipeptidyl aminopeptidase/acylaminoacyl peptidase
MLRREVGETAMRHLPAVWTMLLLALAAPAVAAAPPPPFTLDAATAAPFLSDLVASADGKHIAWVRTLYGRRNIWVADAPGFVPRQATQFTADDGQELTQLTWSPTGAILVFVRGGDHDANWPATGNLQPNPVAGPDEPKVTLWRAGLAAKTRATPITEGDGPALSAGGDLAFLRDGQVWTISLRPKGGGPRRFFFDRGRARDLAWSPDGTRLAFVSARDAHRFIAVWQGIGKPLTYLAPSTASDGDPVWSPDSRRVAFTRRQSALDGYAGFLANRPEPWSIQVVDVVNGSNRQVWASATTLRGSYPDVLGGANLHWGAGDQLVFLSAETNWQQLYSVPASGRGIATRLTADGFMVEHVTLTPDRSAVLFSANTGPAAEDDTRRHILRVAVSGGPAEQLSQGEGIEWQPAGTVAGGVAISAGPLTEPQVAFVASGQTKPLANQPLSGKFAGAAFVRPTKVTFTAPDGLPIHGQLFARPDGAARKPAVIYVHGGPPRQMLLGPSYMRYYANAYAMNQYLAARGFVVLSVNYRLGIGYGWDFQHPDKGGPAGASEYQDVLAAAKWLQAQPQVDPARIGIWGGSYGGLLTAQALARNSDVFKAGVDIHGVHDWSRVLIEELGGTPTSFGDEDRRTALETAWKASPMADIAGWRSPVLFIHGDDDRNVRVNQTVDLVGKLQGRGVAMEQLILPNEIHDFLRHESWLRVDAATAEFLERQLRP